MEIMCNISSIKNAALSALNSLGRTSFSEGGFTRQQADAIAEAISKAIAEYDKQNSHKE